MSNSAVQRLQENAAFQELGLTCYTCDNPVKITCTMNIGEHTFHFCSKLCRKGLVTNMNKQLIAQGKEPLPIARGKYCTYCLKEDIPAHGKSKLQQCSACTLNAYYCNATCQRADWPAHRAECRAHSKDVK